MKKILYTLAASAFTMILHAQTWSVLTTNSTSNLKGIHFPTATIGYAVGDSGIILKTLNGGNTWNSLTTSFPGDWFWDVHFVNADTGWVVGETDPGMNPCGQGLIIKTTDGGASWTTLVSGLSTPVRDLFVLDKDTLFACGGAEQTYSRIAKSFDGGATWTQIGTPELDAVTGGMFFQNSRVGFLGQYIFLYLASWLNTNNGSTFTVSTIPSSGGYWNFASDFPDASHGYFTRSTYVGTDSVYLRKTIDGGTTWNESAIPSFTGSIYGLDFIDSLTGYIAGASGVIRKTTDGGSTWNAQASPTTQELRAVCFVNSGLGFAAGANGTIIRYTGTTGITEINSSSESLIVYPNPAENQITVQVDSDLFGSTYLLTDLLGRTIRTGKTIAEYTCISISELPKGMYLLNLGGENHRSIKVIKK